MCSSKIDYQEGPQLIFSFIKGLLKGLFNAATVMKCFFIAEHMDIHMDNLRVGGYGGKFLSMSYIKND